MHRNNLAEKLPDVKRPNKPSCPSWKLERFGVHVWDPAVDKLARQMRIPKECKAAMGRLKLGKAFGTTGGKWIGQKEEPAPKKPKLTLVKKGISEPGQRRARAPEVTTTDLVDGRKFGKRVVTIRRKQGKRACQHIGKRFFEIATKNIGRGQVFYLAAGYGILESR
jgi:hypothetical protein